MTRRTSISSDGLTGNRTDLPETAQVAAPKPPIPVAVRAALVLLGPMIPVDLLLLLIGTLVSGHGIDYSFVIRYVNR